GLLVVVVPGAAHAVPCTFTCPSQDQGGFDLGESDPGPPLFCSYPADPNEDPHDFYCTYDTATGELVQDVDADLCPSNAVCSNATCGNDIAEAGEQCDGSDLNGETCTDFGFTGGALSCDGSCSFDTSGCTSASCGDGTANGQEACDGSDLRG